MDLLRVLEHVLEGYVVDVDVVVQVRGIQRKQIVVGLLLLFGGSAL